MLCLGCLTLGGCVWAGGSAPSPCTSCPSNPALQPEPSRISWFRGTTIDPWAQQRNKRPRVGAQSPSKSVLLGDFLLLPAVAGALFIPWNFGVLLPSAGCGTRASLCPLPCSLTGVPRAGSSLQGWESISVGLRGPFQHSPREILWGVVDSGVGLFHVVHRVAGSSSSPGYNFTLRPGASFRGLCRNLCSGLWRN